MLPRWHILWGAVFTVMIWVFAQDLKFIYLSLIFFGAVFIDFDHYLLATRKNKFFSLKKTLDFFEELNKKEIENYKEGKREKGYLFLFHTIEFHVLVALLGFIWVGFFYVFIGMFFHSLLDLVWLLKHDMFYTREFFLFSWARRKIF